jgi:hypothetical protein
MLLKNKLVAFVGCLVDVEPTFGGIYYYILKKGEKESKREDKDKS